MEPPSEEAEYEATGGNYARFSISEKRDGRRLQKKSKRKQKGATACPKKAAAPSA